MADSKLRVASLISSGTEILFGLGLGENVVAVSHECDYPPAAKALPCATRSKVDSLQPSGAIDAEVKQLTATGSALYEIDRELLLQLQPDVIITQAQCEVCAVSYQDVIDFVGQEPGLADVQVIDLNPQSLSEVLDDVRRIGEMLHVGDTADAYVAQLRARVDRLREHAAEQPIADRPRVICIEWIEPLMLAANWTPEMIEIAGGYCPLTEAGVHSTYASWDDVRNFDPEVIVVAPCGFDLPRTIKESSVIPSWPGFDQLSATRHDRVFAVDGNAYLNRSGPRLVDSAEILAHLFCPTDFVAPQWSSECSLWKQLF